MPFNGFLGPSWKQEELTRILRHRNLYAAYTAILPHYLRIIKIHLDNIIFFVFCKALYVPNSGLQCVLDIKKQEQVRIAPVLDEVNDLGILVLILKLTDYS